MGEQQAVEGPTKSGSARLTDTAFSHLALFATLAVFVGAALKVWIASHGSMTTFTTLAGTLNPTQVLVVIVPLVLPIVLLFAVVLGLLMIIRRGLPAQPYQAFVLAGLLAVLTLMPLYAMAIAIGMLVITLIYRWADDRWRPSRKPNSVDKSESPAIGLSGILLLCFFFFLLSDGNLWLPPEVVEVRGGERLTAYVIESTDDYLVIMREDDRTVLRVERSDVTSRSYCELGDQAWYFKSLVQLNREAVDYPNCPRA